MIPRKVRIPRLHENQALHKNQPQGRNVISPGRKSWVGWKPERVPQG